MAESYKKVKQAISKQDTIDIKKIFSNPDDIKPVYATEMHLQGTDNEYYLSFYHTVPPLEIDLERLSKIKDVPSNLVARIVVSPSFLIAIQKLLNDKVTESKDESDKNSSQ